MVINRFPFRRCPVRIPSLFVVILLSVGFAPSVAAHGTDKHQPDTKMSEHMRSMMAVKESIPEEFRIMDRTPVRPDAASLRQGRDLFLQNCSVCHGDDGDGRGPAAANLKTAPANFLDRKHSDIYGPGEKYWIVAHGSEGTGMPAFPQLSPVERWHLVNHILNLQRKSPKALPGHELHQ